MRCIRNTFVTCIACACACLYGAEQQPSRGDVAIDTARSTLTVRVYRTGIFKFAGDNHEIQAPIESGVINASLGSVWLRVEATKLKVLDPNLSPAKRQEVQQKMLSPDVLDAARYRTIEFRSQQVVGQGTHHWLIRGELTLHGETRPISFVVTRATTGHYSGSVMVKQTDFGIAPITIAGGTVKVKDEVKVEFVVVPR